MARAAAGVACGLATRTRPNSDEIEKYQILTDIVVSLFWCPPESDPRRCPYLQLLMFIVMFLKQESGFYSGYRRCLWEHGLQNGRDKRGDHFFTGCYGKQASVIFLWHESPPSIIVCVCSTPQVDIKGIPGIPYYIFEEAVMQCRGLSTRSLRIPAIWLNQVSSSSC